LKVIVIGGGIIGLFISYYLAKKGVNVTVIDKNFKNKASIYNAGFISPTFAKAPRLNISRIFASALQRGPLRVSPIEMLKDPVWFINAAKSYKNADEIIKELVKISLELYREIVSKEKIYIDLIEGVLGIFKSYEEAELYYNKVKNDTTKILTAEELSELGYVGFGGGIYSKHDISINPMKLYNEIYNLTVRYGGKIIIDNIKNINESSDSCYVVLEKEGRLEADFVIISAGIWSKEICSNLGYKIPLKPARGIAVIFDTKGIELIKYPALLEDYGIGVSQHSRDIFRAAAFFEITYNPTWDSKNLDRLFNILRTHIKEFERCERCKPVEIGIGFRPCSTDLLPIIGKLPKYKRIYIATGHCRQGVSLAPVTAAIISSIILGERNLPVKSQIVERMSPVRFI